MEDRITSSNWYVADKFNNKNQKKTQKNKTPGLNQGKRLITADEAPQDRAISQKDDFLEVQ